MKRFLIQSNAAKEWNFAYVTILIILLCRATLVSGTSFASPLVAALAGLIKSLNVQLPPGDVENIVRSSAVDLGATGPDNFYGHGRINAYQALLLTHAYSNKSMSATATAQNNGRRLVRDSSGKYHLVFESGITSGGNVFSEIFYRNYNGTSWNTPIRLSAGNEQNRYPCITANGNTLYVVWQRKNGSTHDVYFATSQNSGSTWSSYVLASTSLAADPLPVIQAGVTANFSLMAIYRTNSGGSTRLVARRTTSVNPILSNWSAETTVPSTGANDFSPSLASTPNYWGQDANFGVSYATTTGQIQYRYYQHATGGWSSTQFNLSAIIPATHVIHQTPSLTGIPGSTSLHVGWYMEYTNNSGAYRHSIIHRKSNGFDNWPNVYTELFGDRFRPSMTSVSSSTADLIFQYAVNDNGIAKMRYNGSSWGSVTTVSSVGKYPSVSTGSSNAKFVWTSGSSSPYTINLSSEVLSKSVSDQPFYSRSIAWLDGTGAYLEVRIHQIGVKIKDGTMQKFEFVPASLDSFQLTPANSWSFLTSTPAVLPADAESLFVDYTVAANLLQSVANAGGNRYVNVDVKNTNGQTLASKAGLLLPSSGAIAKTTQRLAVAVNTLGTASLQASVEVKGLAAKPTTFASLGHIYDFTQTGSQSLSRSGNREQENAPRRSVLFENYPDPFNPATTIKYQIAEASHVTLKIYNVIGQEIRTLVDNVKEAGSHETRWDGKDYVGHTVPSGIYLYRMQAGEFTEVKKMVMVR
ncbi:MAG: S8 family serine peptidase [candidate division KSB1 bacterium]|nr:S8 family serine peptidase [candidate division KSB1 bacterium]MDZ7407110.1 S8 family serine peptidase [candidate division KSB1 bacterium]